MKIIHRHRWCRLLPVLAAFIATTAFGQGIIHVQAPIANPDDPYFPWSGFGSEVGAYSPFSIVINGQTVLNFTSGFGGVVAQPSTSSAVIGKLYNPVYLSEVWCLPVSAGTEIGPNLAAGAWMDGGNYNSFLLTGVPDQNAVGITLPTLGWFNETDPANTYLGFDFQAGGNTYYGWVQVGCPLPCNTAWIYSYAYSTIPNTPIFAGQVPEPATLGLLGLGGLAWVLARRKTPSSR